MSSPLCERLFGKARTGEPVHLFTLNDATGVEVSIMTYGAAIQRLVAPDRDGGLANIALGFPTLAGYLVNTGHYFGATVGRYANRIAGGRFILDGVVHELSKNDGDSCLHGGAVGFDSKVWEVVDASAGLLALTYASPDGEMGFPGVLHVRVEYRLEGGELRINYEATTSAPTVVNLTNHTCWNLAGEGSGSVDSHVLMLNASSLTPVGPQLIPTGELQPVAGTPFDFRAPIGIGARGRGYDHNFVLDREGASLSLAARVAEPTSGRTLELLTTEPGTQLYTGTSLDGTYLGPGGPYRRGYCLALETQHFPDSPNQPTFPSTVLRPGERFTSATVYRFGIGR
jgi:aldose 1-epimerase